MNRILVLLSAVFVLNGCAGPVVDEHKEKLATKPICCQSLVDLPYTALKFDLEAEVEIGPTSPVFSFATGRSFFSAYRLPPLANNGDVRRLLRLQTFSAYHGLEYVFIPRLTFLDADFQVTRTVKPVLEYEAPSSGKRSSWVGELAIAPLETHVVVHSGKEELEDGWLSFPETETTVRFRLVRIGKGFGPITTGRFVGSAKGAPTGKIALLVEYGKDARVIENGPIPLYDRNGNSELQQLIWRDEFEAAMKLLSSTPEDLDHQNLFGATALHFAAWKNQPALIRALLKAGASKAIKDAQGATAQDDAKSKGYSEVATLLD